jgi:cbb3-type cytochrome oxidase subunit 3
MRDLVAGLVAAGLVFFALSLLTTLHIYRKRQREAREREMARGRRIIVELPTDPELTLFTEDAEHFYYGATAIDKHEIMAVRVLINGSPIAGFVSPRWQSITQQQPTSFEDRPDGIARDRWDVAIETVHGLVLVECGSVRERVSQELGRKIFDAVKSALENEC